MTNRERQRKSSKNSFGGLGIVAVILLINAVNIAAVEGKTIGIIAVAVILCALGFSVAFAMAKKKSGAKAHASTYQKEKAQEKAMRYFTREETAEEAIKCAHPRGREKYIHQLDNFLANGIIDKNEYRVLKARYEKANIPENMH